jgi:hypothetical protein
MLDRIKTAYTWGPLVGFFGVLYTLFEAMALMLTEVLWPIQDIDITRSFNSSRYNENVSRYGDHELYVDNTDTRQKKEINQIID